jgi:glutamate/aspartate transport system substrate-binding protein
MMKMKLPVFLIAFCLLFGSTKANSQEIDPTLRKIQNSGTLVLGSYLDDKKVAVGFAQDLMSPIGEAIKLHLKLQKLEIRRVPITLQNRFEQVARGVIDMECNSTTNTLERQKEFAFSNSFFVATTRLLTRKTSGIKDLQDLSGRRVLTIGNSTSETLLKQLGATHRVTFETVIATDMSMPPMTQLQSGQVDAFFMDDIDLYSEIANSSRPNDWIVTGAPRSREAYACMMRKDSPALKKVVDTAISNWMRSGRAAASYKKWFQSPTPPAGVNLGFPMSAEVEYLFRNPNDQALH